MTIARGQLESEDRYAATVMASGGDLLFIDTDMYVMKVWSEFVFDRCETWILEQIARRRYTGYLLCRTDLPWAEDELREYPDLVTRERLFHIYKDILVNQSTPWIEVGGEGEGRVRAGVEAVRKLCVASAGGGAS